MAADIRPELLARYWVHSHEEDKGAVRVYRPRSYPFPRSRGRDAFELLPDGTAVDHAIAPADGSTDAPARWTLENGDRLVIRDPASGAQRRGLKVVKVTEDRLEVSPE